MRPRFELHAGKLSDDGGSFNGAQGLRKLRRGPMDFHGYEHAEVDLDLVCRTRLADLMGDVPSGQALKSENMQMNKKQNNWKQNK